LKSCTGTFRFGPDFYQRNAEVALTSNGTELFMRWPSGYTSALIPLAPEHFVDRAYWEDVVIQRDPSGQPNTLLLRPIPSVITLKPAIRYQFKTGQRDWPKT
jgi:hypothetical protein